MPELLPWDRDLVYQNALASSNDTCAKLNNMLTTGYLDVFDAWALSVKTGRVSPANPPRPPQGYVVVEHKDDGLYPTVELSGQPVCDVPEIPQAPEPHTSAGGQQDPDKTRNVPPGDMTPVGAIITDVDGSKWQKCSNPTPFGTSYYYQRVQ